MSNQISFGPPAEELTRGQSVQVPIVLRLESAVKVRGIHARFHGAEETKATYTTTTTTGKGQVSTTTHTAVEHVTIVEKEHLLAGRERAGFFANLGDAVSTMFGGGRHQLMPPGDYEYTVEVAIPADVPATHTGDRSRVFYELSCLIDIPLGRDLKEVYSFRVAPFPPELTASPVRVRYPDDEGRGFWDKLFGPDIRIELALATDVLSRDGSVEGIFQVETDQPLEVRAIRVRLVGHESSQAHGHSDSHHFQGEAVEIATPGSIQGTYSERFSLSAGTVREMPVSAKGELFSIDWFVQVEFDVPWAKDPTIRAPIVLTP
jgi:hypothetical protein